MSKMIEMKLDGKTVSVPEGMNLVDAARLVGVDIPNLCHLEHMRGVGACRMCVVEVEGRKGTMTACTMKTKADLDVITESDQLKDIRRMVIDLILSMHPLDCMTCPKAGVCWLQDLAYRLDVRESTYTRKSFDYPVDDANGFIERDPNYCILCGKCVRVCKAQDTNVLEFMGRGVGAKVGTALDKPLQDSGCTFCGSCVDACPVNALLESGRRLKGREWDFLKTETTCTLCGSACEMVVSEKDGDVVKITSTQPNGFLCAAGRFGYDALRADGRIASPMKRNGSGLEAVSWDDAVSLIADRFNEAKAAPDGIGVVASASVSNEDAYILGKFGRAVLGTNNVDSTASLYDRGTIDALRKVYGKIPEAERRITGSDAILAIGLNCSQWQRALPGIDAEIRKATKEKAKLIVADPAKTRLAEDAALHLELKEGTDTALLAAITAGIIKEKLTANGAEEREGFAALKDQVASSSPGDAGISDDDVAEAVKILGEAKNPVIVYGAGVTAKSNAVEAVTAIHNLAQAAGAQVLPAGLEANVLGAAQMGLRPDLLPGLRALDDGKAVSEVWGADIPGNAGKAAPEMLAGGMKALILVGDVPVGEKPADFVVTLASHPCPATDVADVVIPTAAFVEQEGSLIDSCGELRDLWSAVEPPEDAMAPWGFAAVLAEELGGTMQYEGLEDVMEEIESLAFAPADATETPAKFVAVAADAGEGAPAVKTAESMLRLSGGVLRASRVRELLEAAAVTA